jgi:hypothetical protein
MRCRLGAPDLAITPREARQSDLTPVGRRPDRQWGKPDNYQYVRITRTDSPNLRSVVQAAAWRPVVAQVERIYSLALMKERPNSLLLKWLQDAGHPGPPVHRTYDPRLSRGLWRLPASVLAGMADRDNEAAKSNW